MAASGLVSRKQALDELSSALRIDEIQNVRERALAVAAVAKTLNDAATLEWSREIVTLAEQRLEDRGALSGFTHMDVAE